MQVETFEVFESAEMQSPEFAEEAVRLIEELGLAGQAKLLSKREDGGTVTRNPYRQITAEEEFVYRSICPATSKPEDYASGAMPLRIMQVLAHAKSLGCFTEFEVWHPTDFTVKDPVLIGLAQDPRFDAATHPWMKVRHIIARWGETLDSFATLKEQAVKSYRSRITAELNEAKAGLDMALATVNGCDDSALASVALKHRSATFSW